MVTINADDHPGLHRYSLELAKYPELSEEQYNGSSTVYARSLQKKPMNEKTELKKTGITPIVK